MLLRKPIRSWVATISSIIVACAIVATSHASILTAITAYRIDVGDARDVESTLRKIMKQVGNDPFTLHDLGTVVYRQGQVDAARLLWDEASKSDGELASADIEIVYQQIQQGRIEAAQTSLRRAMQRRPTDPHVFLAEAQMAMHQRDVEAARVAYQKALSISPRSFTANLEYGRFVEMMGNIEQAQQLYKVATEIRPKHGAGWVLLALSEFRRDNIDGCLRYLRTAEEVKPTEQHAEARLAEMYFNAGDYVSACQWYKQALARDENDLLVKVRYGQMLCILGKKDGASKVFREIVSENEFTPALIALAQLEQSQDQLKKSAELYQRVLKQNPDNVIANNNLGMLYVELKMPPEDAMKFTQKALQLEPNSGNVQSTYGCVLAYANKNADAVEILRKVVRVEPTNAWVRYCYGLSLHRLNESDKARQQFEACLLLDENFPMKSEIEAFHSNKRIDD